LEEFLPSFGGIPPKEFKEFLQLEETTGGNDWRKENFLQDFLQDFLQNFPPRHWRNFLHPREEEMFLSLEEILEEMFNLSWSDH